MSNRHPYLTNLTPLRGLAALCVALFHFTGAIDNINLPHFTWIIRKGYLMVDLFFIMSGFIIMHTYGESFRGEIKKTALTRFVVARFARIYPLHLFMLLFLVAYTGIRHQWSEVCDPGALPMHLLLLHKNSSDLLSVLMFTGILLSFSSNNGGLHRLCSLPPLQFLGKISYSIYLTQTILIVFFLLGLDAYGAALRYPFDGDFPIVYRLLCQAIYLSILIGISTLTCYGIEMPCRNYINKKFMPSSPLAASAS